MAKMIAKIGKYLGSQSPGLKRRGDEQSHSAAQHAARSWNLYGVEKGIGDDGWMDGWMDEWMNG